MLTFAIKLKDLLLQEEGQDLVEYALILALIVLACIGGVGGFGAMVQGMITTIDAAAEQLVN
jgi:Flp pilus assembly pilin Flp